MLHENGIFIPTFKVAILSLCAHYTKKDIDDVKKLCDDYFKVLDETIAAQRVYERARDEIEDRRVTRTREWMKKNGSAKPPDGFEQEYEKSRNLKSPIFDKERQVSRRFE